MPIFNLLFSLILLSPHAAAAQDGVPGQDEASALALEVEYEQLNSRFKNDLTSWSVEEHRLRKQGVTKDGISKHPGYEYQPFFAGLAERGDPSARVWMIKNPAFHGETVQIRREVLHRWYRALITENSDGEFMREVIEELAGSPKRIGEEFALAMLEEIPEHCQNSEIIAASIYHQAWLLSKGMSTKDPERKKAAIELMNVLVSGYPDAEDSAMAAGILFSVESTALRLALHEWCDASRAVLAEGGDSSEWPANPVHQFQAHMTPLGAAGSEQALLWVTQFYPAFDQRERRSRELGTLWLGQEFSKRRSSAEHYWMDLKFDILDLSAEVCSEKDWAFDLVKGLHDELPFFLPDRYAPLLRKVLEKSSDARVREQATLTLARSLSKSAHYTDLIEGLRTLQLLETTATFERISKEAEEHREAFEKVMPGAKAPQLRGKDAEGLEIDLEQYKGKVVLLWFWSFTRQDEAHFDEMRQLIGRMEGEDFVVLGVNCDLRSPSGFQREAKKKDLTWRNALQYRPMGHMTQAYSIFHWPSAILLDRDGVIRGRNIDLAACEELAKSLLKADD
jgi:peroxiredoxin